MSLVIAVASLNFALMISDGKKVELKDGIPFETGRVEDENIKKMVKLNDSLCMGFAGNFELAMMVVDKFKTIDCINMKLEDVSSLVEQWMLDYLWWLEDNKSLVKLEPSKLHFLFAGKSNKTSFAISTVSSTNEFCCQYSYPNTKEQIAIYYAAPYFERNKLEEIFSSRIYTKLKQISTLDALVVRLENLIKNVANQTIDINKVIFKELIV